MIFSAQRTWGRRTNSHALLRNFAPSGNPAAMSCRGRRQPHRGGACQISRANVPRIQRRLRAPGFQRGERPLEKKSSAPLCVSWGLDLSFPFKATCVRARVSTINGLEVSPRLLYLVGDLPEQVRVQQYVPRDRLVAQSTKNFALPSRSNRPVAGERGYDALMAQILRPGLESLGIELEVVGELNQRVPERVRIVIGQSGPSAGFPKNIAYGVGVRPRRPIKPYGPKSEVLDLRDPGLWEQGIVRSEFLLLAQEQDPIDDDAKEVVADREEPRGERLRLFDVDLARIVVDELPSDIDVLQTKRDDRLVARARQNGKGDDSAVALGDLALVGNAREHGANIVERRARFEPVRGRYSRHAARRAEIFRARILDSRRIPRLIR